MRRIKKHFSKISFKQITHIDKKRIKGGKRQIIVDDLIVFRDKNKVVEDDIVVSIVEDDLVVF